MGPWKESGAITIGENARVGYQREFECFLCFRRVGMCFDGKVSDRTSIARPAMKLKFLIMVSNSAVTVDM